MVILGLFALVGDDTALNFRIVGLLYRAKPGFVVSDSSPYYVHVCVCVHVGLFDK